MNKKKINCIFLVLTIQLMYIFLWVKSESITEQVNQVKTFTIQDTFDVLKDIHKKKESDISKLVKHIMKQYLSNCMIILLYDELFYSSVDLRVLIKELLEYSPLPVMHGMINTTGLTYQVPKNLLHPPERKCRNFILLTKNLENSAELVGRQRDSKIVFVAYTSSYKIKSFLSDSLSHNIVNLLIIADPNLQHDEFSKKSEFYSIDLYTHRLYVDSLGSSQSWILTSWRNGNFTRPWVNLFPKKMDTGFFGHRFRVSVGQQPPFVFRKQKFDFESTTSETMIQKETYGWDGLEIKILKYMSHYLNMTFEITEASNSNEGDGIPGRVNYDIMKEKATIGISGMPVTNERLHNVSFSASHTQDCAVFISLTSLALPKYRAIFGPFKWEVWVCLVLVYLLAIVPLSFSDKLTLRHLYEKPSEIENMFWYVFGTFTNLFTFRNKNSWTSSTKGSTRAFVGSYWVFSIIITAAYTGSIIAFITLPVFPETIDTIYQLRDEGYRIITLDSGGWQKFNETQKKTIEHDIFKHREMVPKIEDGLRNVTKGHLLWDYAFMGSKYQLEHIIRNNFQSKKKKKNKRKFHISKQCYQPLYVSFAFSKNSLLNTQLDIFILRAQQSGLLNKWMRDVQWDNWRTVDGHRFQASSGDLKIMAPEDRMLTLDDTQGMFLLMGFGFFLAIVAFLNEFLTHFKKQVFCCQCKSEDHNNQNQKDSVPTIMLTPCNITSDTSVEDFNEITIQAESKFNEESMITQVKQFQATHKTKVSVSVYDLTNLADGQAVINNINPHRKYSLMTAKDDRVLVEWGRRNTY